MHDPLFLGATNLVEALARVRGRAPADKTFLLAGAGDGHQTVFNYGDVNARILRLGTLFQQWGLVPGDRVLVATRDDGAMSTAVLACWTFGLCAVIFEARAKPREAEHVIGLSRPSAALLDASLLRSWPVSSIPHVLPVAPAGEGGASASPIGRLVGRLRAAAPKRDSYPATVDAASPREVPTDLSDDAEAYVLFTSGSTSRPKGVRISRGALLAHASTLARKWGYEETSVLYDPLDLSHVDGIVQGPVMAWLAGATCIRPRRFTVDAAGTVLDELKPFGVTHLIVVPAILSVLAGLAMGREAAMRHPEFRWVISTGGYLDERVWRRVEELFGVRVANCYGLTETVTGGCFAGPEPETHRIGTVGKPRDCEVAIAGDDGLPSPGATRGELLLRGANVMMGYLNDETATRAVLRDGWLSTGDLASIDEDGFVRIVGRRKNVVVSGGYNIQPEEVGEALESLPGVREAIAFGVPDEVFGEIVVACVVVAEGSDADEASLMAACRQVLTDYKVPKAIALVAGLPRGAAGKVPIPEARKLFEEHRSRPRARAETGTVRERIRSLASRTFHVPLGTLQDDDGPNRTPGWDSFAHLAFIVGLESAFGVRLSNAEVLEIRSLGSAEQLVVSKLPMGRKAG